MILAVDTHYTDKCATTAGAVFRDISDPQPFSEHIVSSPGPPADYEPGQFYKRELPEILRLIIHVPAFPKVILIDGYCTLDASGRPGLGGHLYDALGGEADIIGVAKTAYKGGAHAEKLLRGRSQTPLYITASGNISPREAAGMVAQMHGPYRIPSLLKRVDQLCREAASNRQKFAAPRD